jgi:hypothetical protein
MRKHILGRACSVLFLLVLFSSNVFASVTVSGKILDRETGESIPGVSVMVKGTQRGAAANVEGFFSIADLPPGPLTLVLTSIGYSQLAKDLTLKDGQDQQMIVRMTPEAVSLNAVEIVAERAGEREYTPKVAQYSLEPRELRALPRVVEADLFRSLQFMPGVLPMSDYSSELNIWGGSSDQNLVLLNGIDVYKPTHLGGLFSAFNMDAVKDVKLIKGGFPARYGGRLSAVVDVADREGNRNQRQAEVGVSFLSSHATFEGPLPHGSCLVAGRRTYVDAATKLLHNSGVIEDEFPYYFYDLNVKATRDFAHGDRISPSAYLGRDVLNITSNTNDRIHMVWGNTTYSLPFVHIYHPKLYSMNTVAGSFFDSQFRFETGKSWSEFANRINDFTLKTDMTWFASSSNTFDFGVLAKSLRVKFRVSDNTEVFHDGTYNGWQLAAYVSDDYRPRVDITVTPGMRIEHNTLSGYTEYLPRLSVKKELSAHSYVSAAAGMYAQPLQQVTFDEGLGSILNSYILLDKTFLPNRAHHFALTYENDFEGPLKLSAGLFYKRFDRVIEYDPARAVRETDRLGDLFVVGDGYAYGGDILIQGDYPGYSFMLGYGLGRSWRKFAAFDDGRRYPASFDRLHNTNLFVSRKASKRATFEMRFNYSTGQPTTRAVGVYSEYDLPPQYFVPGYKNGYRMPPYFRWDIAYRLRYEKKHWTFSPYFEIINLLNRKNVLGYSYDLSTNPVGIETLHQIPFLPSIGFTAEF